MSTKVKINETQKEVLRNAYFYLKVRFIAFCNGLAKCYSENSEFLFETSSGALYEVACQLTVGEVVMITEILNSPSSE